MEFRVIKVTDLYTVQVQVLPTVKVLAVEFRGQPVEIDKYPVVREALLCMALHEIQDSVD